MSFWRRGRASRADRAVGVGGRTPDPEKVSKASMKAQRRALFDEMARTDQAVTDAARSALRRLEAQGFDGAVERADPQGRMHAAWPLCEALADHPDGGTETTTYYLFSTGEVVDEGGGSILACREPGKVVAALNGLT